MGPNLRDGSRQFPGPPRFRWIQRTTKGAWRLHCWILNRIPGPKQGKPTAEIHPKFSSNDFSDVWKKVADWRDVALGPRSVKLHERLSRQTKELPPLQDG